MAELPRYLMAPYLALRDVEAFSNERIADMLYRAELLGLPMGPGSPLEDLTLREFEILVQHAEPC